MDKPRRVAEFLRRLQASAPQASALEARTLLNVTLAAVEDEFCPPTEERMGPPLDDNRRSVPDRADVARYRTRGHNVFFGDNGAICIEEIASGDLVLDKSGADGRRVFEPPE